MVWIHATALYAALEYTRTFKPKQLANYFFGSDLVDGNSLLIQGSRVEERARCCNAWLADYFGLPMDFNSKVSFCPRIHNVILDLNWYQGLDNWTEGLYFRLHFPVACTQWELRMSECIMNAGTEENGKYPCGYMGAEEVLLENLAPNFIQAISGCHTWGDMKCPIKYGIMSNCKLTLTKLADLRFTLGYNFVRKEDGHLGILLQFAAPTGNKPDPKYLFSPIVGNGKHWEFGGGITASWIFWRDEEKEDHHIGIWMDANITHLFERCQCRSFDLCCKPNSRYMLLEQVQTNTLIQGGPDAQDLTLANYQYAQNLIPAINWSTFNVDVKIDVQADLALKFAWTRENWSFDLGYNLWARTGEKFCQRCCDDCCYTNNCCNVTCCDTCTSAIYAIKGDSYLYGFATEGGTAKPLSATQSCADIHTGKNFAAARADTSVNAFLNPAIDNPQKAFDENNVALADCTMTYTVNTSIQPILINKCDLALCKGPSAITHKLFLHANYAWKDKEDKDDWIPFLGLGGEVEWAQGMSNCCCCCDSNCGSGCNSCNTNCCSSSCCDPCCNVTYACDPCCNTSCCAPCGTSCNSCCTDCCNDCCDKKRAGVSQWGVWIKGGVAFD